MDTLLNSGARYSHRLAVVDARVTLSYRRLTRMAAVLRGIIRRATAADRVGVCLPASAMFPAVFFGILWSGKKVVPLNFLLAADELEAVVRDARLDLVVSIRHFGGLLAELPVRVLMLEGLPLKRKLLTSGWRGPPPVPPVDPDETAVILYTSGTSGLPKGVELTHRNLHSNCVNCVAAARFIGEHRFLNVLPPFHVFGLTANVLAPMVCGCTVFCRPRFQPSAVLECVRQRGISVLMATPSMYAALARVKSPPPEGLSRLYLAISGGEPLTEEVATHCRERLGAELFQGYGLTETSPVVSLCTPHAYRHGTVGRPIADTQVCIVDDDGREAAAGETGEIRVRGPGVMKGYHGLPEETAAVKTPEGWLKTGDLGTLDAEGYLRVTGRRKELIIVAGENVFPGEIEAVLAAHPAVREAAVLGVADARRGEVPTAFVVVEEGASVEPLELRRFARDRLAGYKVPREVRILADLPHGPTGKVLKRKLRELP